MTLNRAAVFGLLLAVGACEGSPPTTLLVTGTEVASSCILPDRLPAPEMERVRPDEVVADRPIRFHMLAVTWMPETCKAGGDGQGDLACGGDNRFGWTLHGLWPNSDGRPTPATAARRHGSAMQPSAPTCVAHPQWIWCSMNGQRTGPAAGRRRRPISSRQRSCTTIWSVPIPRRCRGPEIAGRLPAPCATPSSPQTLACPVTPSSSRSRQAIACAKSGSATICSSGRRPATTADWARRIGWS